MSQASAAGLLFDPQALRRIWRGVRRDPTAFAVGGAADPDLLDPVAEPFDSVDDVADRLGRLETRLAAADDRRSVFLTVYTEMTARTARAIEAGAFANAAWMRRYLVEFAEYYRRAFRAFETGAFERVPDPWLVAFGTAVRGDALVVQDAFLGINAHVNYDLALTLEAVGVDPDRDAKYADHRRVDDVLRRLVSVQRELLAERYAPGLQRVGAELRGLDEELSGAALRGARETAWRTACVRTDPRWRSVDRYTRWFLRRTATGGAFLLLQPTASDRTMTALRDAEADRFDLAAYAQAFHDRAASTC